ncbi:MAG: S8 family serine peptidase, partial [Candidatus Bathyarchaeia archaeon]
MGRKISNRKILKQITVLAIVILVALSAAFLAQSQAKPSQTDRQLKLDKYYEREERELKPETETKPYALNQTFKVFLVTGDIIYVTNTSQGLQVLSIEPVDPSNKGQGFQTLALGEHLYVIPSYVNLKKYDLSLFDVAYLIKEGYVNESSYRLITKALSKSATISITAKVSDLKKEFKIEGKVISDKLNLLSLEVGKDAKSISKMFKEILESENIDKIWLDRKIRVSLDKSALLIGATDAWSLGYTGSGIRIAVLDTGIDPTHPDFKFPNGTYKVILNASFVGYPSEEVGNAADYHGHGTHCASIAAGTGLASLRTREVEEVSKIAYPLIATVYDDVEAQIVGNGTHLALIWCETQDWTSFTLWFSLYDGNVWTPREMVDTGRVWDFPYATFLSDGSIIIFWPFENEMHYEIHYKIRNPDGNWGEEKVLEVGLPYTKIVNGGVTQLLNGSIAITFALYDEQGQSNLYYMTSPDKGNTWNSPIKLTNGNSTMKFSQGMSLQTKDGTIIVLYEEVSHYDYFDDYFGDICPLYYNVSFDGGKTWPIGGMFAQGSGFVIPFGLELSNGTILVVFQGDDLERGISDVIYSIRYYPSTNSWSSITRLGFEGHAWRPTITRGPGGIWMTATSCSHDPGIWTSNNIIVVTPKLEYQGVAPKSLLMVGKVLNRWGWGYESWIINGIDWAVENGANVISMSLGGGYTDGTDPLSMACDWAVSQGVTVVVAAGNGGDRYWTTTAPGTAFNVITVGASDDYDNIAQFSSRGPTFDLRVKPDIVAPGVNIMAARVGGGYVGYSGTSMATPHVAGAAAIILQRFPFLNPADVKNLLLSTSKPLLGYNIYQQGSGRLDVSHAVNPVLFLSPAQVNLKTPTATVVNTTITLVSLWSSDVALTFEVYYSSVDHPDETYPSNAFYVSNGTVILPAGGVANINFVANFTSLPAYDYWGIINILDANEGKVLAHGIFSAFNWRKLTVQKIYANGNPAVGNIVSVFFNETRYGSLIWGWSGFYDFTNSSGMVDFYLPEGFYNVVTSRYDGSSGRVYSIVKQARLTTDVTVTLDERETYEVRLSNTAGLTPMEKNIILVTPVYRVYPDWYYIYMYGYGWRIYYPSSLSDYALTPYPTVLGYKLVPSDKVNPSYPDLIESDTLYMPTAFFENITSSKVIVPSYEMTVNVEYRTYATPRVSAETWLNLQMYGLYNGSGYYMYLGSYNYKLNAPKTLTLKINPFWLGTTLNWAELEIEARKYRDLPGVSTPYWDYEGYVPLLDLYDQGLYDSRLYLTAEPEIRRNDAGFNLENGRLRGLEFWSWQTGAFNYTYCYSPDATYYNARVLVNGSEIPVSLSRFEPSYIYVYAYDIDFNLPAKVEVFHDFTSNRALSSSISAKNTFIVENWGNGWYGHVPLQFDYDRAVEVVGLDWNNTLTTVKPVIVNVYIYSYNDLTHAVLRYKYGATWHNSTLISHTGFGPGYRRFTFALDPMVNRTFVDLSIYFKDVKGNEMRQDITRAFYVETVYSSPMDYVGYVCRNIVSAPERDVYFILPDIVNQPFRASATDWAAQGALYGITGEKQNLGMDDWDLWIDNSNGRPVIPSGKTIVTIGSAWVNFVVRYYENRDRNNFWNPGSTPVYDQAYVRMNL